jgi:threonine synthase
VTLGYVCSACGAQFPIDTAIWRCATCGEVLELPEAPAFTEQNLATEEPGLWRYASAMPPLPAEARVRLGEVMTPLVVSERLEASLKVDYLMPSGSYKDRGSAVLISRLCHLGIDDIIEDSSGNAGSSIAAYSAAAGLKCQVFVPAANSPDKLAQIKAYGAQLVAVEGDRSAVAAAALAGARTHFYASHNWHPDFHAGVASLGFEIWEQCGRRAPEAVVVPCGHGSLVLGVYRAFSALLRGGSVSRLPKIFAIQSEAYSAVARAWAQHLDTPLSVQEPGGTIAEGIATRLPLRGRAVLGALRESGGAAIAVGESDIRGALVTLVRMGYYVEPTSAVAVAGLMRLRERALVSREASSVITVLTGMGLKAGRRIAEVIEDAPASVAYVGQGGAKDA